MSYPEPPSFTLPPPGTISPFIRFTRWSLLLVGVVYGATRHSYLQRRANRNKSLRDARIEMRAKQAIVDKKIAEKRSIEDLEKVLNVKLT